MVPESQTGALVDPALGRQVSVRGITLNGREVDGVGAIHEGFGGSRTMP
jgi:hypothetical protein